MVDVEPPLGAEAEIVENRMFCAVIFFVVRVAGVVVLNSESIDQTQLRSAVVSAAVSDDRNEREFSDLRTSTLGFAVAQSRNTVHILELMRNFESEIEIFVDEEMRTERKCVFNEIVVVVFVAVRIPERADITAENRAEPADFKV